MRRFFQANHGILWYLRNFIPMVLFPIANCYLFQFYICNPFESMKPSIQLLNIYLFELLMLVFFFLFGLLKWSLRLQSVFFMLAGLADYYVISFRSAPIMPWDIYSIGTALSVADNFQYTVEFKTVLVTFGFLALILAESIVTLDMRFKDSPKDRGSIFPRHSFPLYPLKRRALVLRIVGLAAAVSLLCGFTRTLHLDSTVKRYGIYDKLFTPTVMSKRDGIAVAFLMELKYIAVDRPKHYSAEAADAILSPYRQEDKDSGRRPNIIVIMNEAYSDPAVLGEFTTNEDYMPFTHSLMQADAPNTVSGFLNVSVLGGNTANTEFEFLTGNTMAFLPQGSVAYQQYVRHPLPSLASHLQSLGYRTVAMHPYNSTGWDRDRVYPLLGFETSCFIRDYKNPKKIRKYVSDASCYDKIIEMYEKKPEDTPLFIFNVTMQNHSSYTEAFDNFRPGIAVEGSSSKALNNYLSLIKLSDEALRDLIGYFSEADEDTMIVFFGDHQPTDSVVSNIWKLNGKKGGALSEADTDNRYKVPFLIWCNFDIEGAHNIETSANYLGAKVLAAGGLPLYDYARYLLALSEDYPVVTAIRAENAAGESTEIAEVLDALNDYAVLQYRYIFD
ncbi:MAG: LTA synthase family protein [Roseburia sp.]|nr:LTA synthase family protein [Roseburia sp.]